MNLNDIYELQFSLIAGDSIIINYANLETEVVIPSAWIGNYMAPGEEGNFYLTITEDSITYSMPGSTISDFTLTGPNTFTIGQNFAKFTVSVDGDTVTIIDDDWGDVFTTYTPVAPNPSIQASWIGTWVYTSPMGMTYTLVVTENSITYSAPGATTSNYTLDGNAVTFMLDGETVTLTFTETDGVVTLTDNYDCEYELQGGEEEGEIPASWIGTWVCDDGMYNIIVTDSSITYKDYSMTLTEYVINGNEVSFGNGYIIFTFAEADGVLTVTDNYGGVYVLDDGGSDVTPNPDIQASWVGTWSYTDLRGMTYTLTVSESSMMFSAPGTMTSNFVIDGNTVTFSDAFGEGEDAVLIFTEVDGVVTVTDESENVYEFQIPEIEILPEYYGTYVGTDESEAEYTIVVVADGITINGDTVELLSYTEEGWEVYYTVDWNGDVWKLSYAGAFGDWPACFTMSMGETEIICDSVSE
ncbi:MAG: hypothetical protein K2I77_02495 [Anaeroplasmataceae bacterium]|nr:hypothetical protein [Anaeroplasmataceae bacterium]